MMYASIAPSPLSTSRTHAPDKRSSTWSSKLPERYISALQAGTDETAEPASFFLIDWVAGGALLRKKQ
jgi:hypothetical protein